MESFKNIQPFKSITPLSSKSSCHTFVSCNGASRFKKPVEGSLWVLPKKKEVYVSQHLEKSSLWFHAHVWTYKIYLYVEDFRERIATKSWCDVGTSCLLWGGGSNTRTAARTKRKSGSKREVITSKWKEKVCVLLQPGAHGVRGYVCVDVATQAVEILSRCIALEATFWWGVGRTRRTQSTEHQRLPELCVCGWWRLLSLDMTLKRDSL